MATARPFAYNTGTGITGTSQVGDLAVGTPSAGFNLNPRFWNGPNEELGYVIAHPVPSGTQPTPVSGVSAYLGFNRSSDFTGASFIEIAEYVASTYSTPQTFSSGATASAWLTANGFWNSWGVVSTDNLTLQLDASNSASYPGSGSTWYDLVSPQQNITLTGSPTYTSTSPGYFSFSGTGQYGTGTGTVLSNTSYTKSVWFYLNSYTDNNLVSKENQHYMYFSGGNKLYSGHANWAGFPTNFPSTASFNLNQWYCATLTFNTTDGMKLYINGTLDSTYTAIKTAFVGDGSINVASYGTGNLLDGRIAKVYCYNKSISAAEVLQNYRADVGQFT